MPCIGPIGKQPFSFYFVNETAIYGKLLAATFFPRRMTPDRKCGAHPHDFHPVDENNGSCIQIKIDLRHPLPASGRYRPYRPRAGRRAANGSSARSSYYAEAQAASLSAGNSAPPMTPPGTPAPVSFTMAEGLADHLAAGQPGRRWAMIKVASSEQAGMGRPARSPT